MTVSKRVAEAKSKKFEKNVFRRGLVPDTSLKKRSLPTSTVVIAFFIFVVIGSALLQIIRTATSGGIAAENA